MSSSFKGPLFIVGLSRSGTKLLRNLLNNHSEISLPDFETHFIPELIERNKNGFNLSQNISIVLESGFVKKQIKTEHEKQEFVRTLKNLSENNLYEFVKSILVFFSNKKKTPFIWGDKTPKYLRYLEEIVQLFQNVKIIHIIRDPRDRAISLRRTWWRSTLLAAESWRKEIEYAQKIKLDKNCYLEVRYEDLLDNAERFMHQICDFLQINFEANMLQLKRPVEKYGLTSHNVNIDSNNKGKYINERARLIKKIEELAFPLIIEKGYQVLYANKAKRLNCIYNYILKVYDFFVVRISTRIKGY